MLGFIGQSQSFDNDNNDDKKLKGRTNLGYATLKEEIEQSRPLRGANSLDA
jgi:hypothetical protein